MSTHNTDRPAIVLDTNIWIGALLKPHGHAADVVHSVALRYRPAHTKETLHELICVLEYRRLIEETTPVQRRDYIQSVVNMSTFYRDVPPVQACRDPDDDKFLALAVAAGARTIVSNDNHLLDMKSHEGIPIQSMLRFLRYEQRLPIALMVEHLPYGMRRPLPGIRNFDA